MGRTPFFLTNYIIPRMEKQPKFLHEGVKFSLNFCRIRKKPRRRFASKALAIRRLWGYTVGYGNQRGAPDAPSDRRIRYERTLEGQNIAGTSEYANRSGCV
jgi:hypothetical protein